MRAYNLSGIAASRKKVKKTHGKARLVSILYLIGLLALTVLAFLPCLQIKYEKGNGLFGDLCIANFFRPLLSVFKGKLDGVIVAVIYLIMIIIMLLNFLRSFSYVRKAMKINYRNVNACNRNVAAMEELGDIFSASFSTMIICYFLMYLLTPMEGIFSIMRDQNAFTLMGYVALAVGLVIHFAAGAIGGTSSLFLVGVTVEEKKRKESVWLYFLRNFIQVAVMAGIVYMVAPVCTLYMYIPKFEFSKLFGEEMMVMLGVILQLVAAVLIVLNIKRVTSTVEYNLMGIDAYGMRRYSVFVLIIGLLSVGLFVVDKNWVKNDAMIYNYVVAAALGIVGFVLDLIIRPREKKEKVKEEIRPWSDLKENEEKPEEKTETSSAAPCVLPNPLEVKVTLPTSMDPTGLSAPIGEAPMLWEIKCPVCDKALSVKDGVMYNRCPSCGKVFQVRKGKKGIPNS